MKTFLLITLALTLVSCTKHTKEISNNYELPKGLEDCHIFYMNGSGLTKNLTVIRCPNSQTTTTHRVKTGKSSTTVNTTVIDQ